MNICPIDPQSRKRNPIYRLICTFPKVDHPKPVIPKTLKDASGLAQVCAARICQHQPGKVSVMAMSAMSEVDGGTPLLKENNELHAGSNIE